MRILNGAEKFVEYPILIPLPVANCKQRRKRPSQSWQHMRILICDKQVETKQYPLRLHKSQKGRCKSIRKDIQTYSLNKSLTRNETEKFRDIFQRKISRNLRKTSTIWKNLNNCTTVVFFRQNFHFLSRPFREKPKSNFQIKYGKRTRDQNLKKTSSSYHIAGNESSTAIGIKCELWTLRQKKYAGQP